MLVASQHQQQSIVNFMLPTSSSARTHSFTSKRNQEFDKKLAVFIAKDMMPPSIVEGEGFIKLMKFADPQYVLPSRRRLVNAHSKFYKMRAVH